MGVLKPCRTLYPLIHAEPFSQTISSTQHAGQCTKKLYSPAPVCQSCSMPCMKVIARALKRLGGPTAIVTKGNSHVPARVLPIALITTGLSKQNARSFAAAIDALRFPVLGHVPANSTVGFEAFVNLNCSGPIEERASWATAHPIPREALDSPLAFRRVRSGRPLSLACHC